MSSYSDFLNLPEPYPLVYPTKRYASPPNLSLLKDSQRKVFDGITNWYNNTSANYCILAGYAGTGKSWTTNQFVEDFLTSAFRRVMVTAPTNKAVKTIRDMAEYRSDYLEYNTLHSLLGVLPFIDNYGRERFVINKLASPDLGQYDLIVVDEASMITDELFRYLNSFVYGSDARVLFVGDPKQIPPVGQSYSIPMIPQNHAKYGIVPLALTDIVRQSADNPIIRLTNAIRNNDLSMMDEIKANNRVLCDSNGDGVCILPRKEIVPFLERYFKSKNYDVNPNFVRILGWRNKTVDDFNSCVRRFYFPREQLKHRILEGERLVATKPIMDGTDVIFCNNDEFVATKVELSSLRRRNEKFNIYKTIVSNEERGEEEIHIIHESSLDLFDEMLDNLKSEALSQKQGTDAAGKEWKKYYSFRDSFADVRNCHALTTHKAQGSTYDMVFVCASDIASNIKKQEMIRLLYTAFTRSSKRLIIIPM